MSEHDSSSFEAMARQSMDAWRELWERAVGQMPDWQGGGATATDAGNDTADRVLGGLKAYLEWLESVGSAQAAMPDGQAWGDAMGKFFDGAVNPFQSMLGSMPGMGDINAGAWPGSQAQSAAPMQQAAQALLGLPAFGMLRERQEQQQAMGRAVLEYQQQMLRYQTLMAQAGREAIDRARDKLAGHEEAGRQIDSLRGLYNLWVDAAEEAWAEVAMSDVYREVYGAMTNAQMRVRKLQQQQVADVARQLGLPTREEVDSLGQRLQAMRREVTALRQQLAEQPAPTSRTASAGSTSGGARPSPGNKAVSKKATSKKATSKKATSKKATGKKATGKKATGKKATGKKATGKKATGKKATGKKATGKKATSKKATSKKATGKKATGKKATGKKATGKKATSKKATSKKATSKKATSKKATSKKATSKKATSKKSASKKSGRGR